MSYIDTFHPISNAAEVLQFYIKAAAYRCILQRIITLLIYIL
jgi:hypothetical protein